MGMIYAGGKGEKLFWNWSEENKPKAKNKWFEIEVSGGELELWAGKLHLICRFS